MSSPSAGGAASAGGGGSEQRPRDGGGNDFMSNFDPDLIHRVLLADPADYHELTLSGAPRIDHTPTYREFAKELGFDVGGDGPTRGDDDDIASRISRTMKRAFLDMAVGAAEGEKPAAGGGEGEKEEEDEDEAQDGGDRPPATPTNLEPLKGMVLELHAAVRSLIPHRTDLHGRLSDEDVSGVDDGGDVFALVPRLIRAADALAQLESEDRSRTTRWWIEMAGPLGPVEAASSAGEGHGDGIGNGNGNGNGLSPPPTPPSPFGLSPAQFVATSAAYLHRKAEICSEDVANFKLGNVLAPRIAAGGLEYERSNFRRRFGDFDSDETAPVTREWIRRLAAAKTSGENAAERREDLRAAEGQRAAAVRTVGWVAELLFSGGGKAEEGETAAAAAAAASIAVPEVLHLDVRNVRMIRNTARTSVAGSALALHACTIAGVGDGVLRTDSLPGDVRQCRDALVHAMANRAVGSQEQYERNVSNAVIKLARTLHPSLDAAKEESLASRTSAVLRGEDTVIKLLDSRMREAFRTMMEWEPTDRERVPLSMKTGRVLSLGTQDKTTTYAAIFKEAAKQAFEKKGFAFYAPELASACLQAARVINLVFVLYGEVLLEPIFSQVLEG
eukprot:CAMPEP_0113541080 /NCGR_PEP_ID=MMETSP0015_2-20120614/8834_1 /TAXON_ID=2838 /ORGANISM="Odontella" /LENGTH=615 /DNA_ID=CAMNT_0000440949 /DNA_START=106 /DNA_END=1954 /DNA_ORIENTATION=+ /assembly_acc=CAM_ASM_000160